MIIIEKCIFNFLILNTKGRQYLLNKTKENKLISRRENVPYCIVFASLYIDNVIRLTTDLKCKY